MWGVGVLHRFGGETADDVPGLRDVVDRGDFAVYASFVKEAYQAGKRLVAAHWPRVSTRSLRLIVRIDATRPWVQGDRPALLPYHASVGLRDDEVANVTPVDATAAVAFGPRISEALALDERDLRDDLIVSLLNPKVALFFLSFLPQFLDPSRGSIAGQVIVLGLVLVLLGVTSNIIYALVAVAPGVWLERRPGFLPRQRFVAGGIYISLGILAALAGDRRR